MNRILILAISLMITLASCSQTESTNEQETVTDTFQTQALSQEKTIDYPKRKLTEVIAENNISKRELSIKIDKSAYTLAVYHSDSMLVMYPCVFGFNAIDDKAQEGDGCTPEGTFGIRSMYAHKSWNYFIWIDYPNEESWSRFKKRKANGEIEQSATIGGEVGIHGVPEGGDSMIDNKVNWTLGCISLKNDHIEDLYKSINSSVSIEIIP